VSLARLSVVIPSWNTCELLRACLSSLQPAHEAGCQVIVVDNGSHDGSAAMVAREFEWVELLRNADNEGFARACNAGAQRAMGEYLALLNSDTEVTRSGLERLTAFLDDHDHYAGVAPRLVDAQGRTQKSMMALPLLRTALFFATPLERLWPESAELRRYFARDFDYGRDGDVVQPPAAALVLRRALFNEFDGFDERLWLFFNDVDLCLRLAQAGQKLRYLADVRVLHHEGASTAQFPEFAAEWHRNRLAYYRKHYGRLAGAWIKACTTLAWCEHVGLMLARRVRGQAAEPLRPICRSFGAFLVS